MQVKEVSTNCWTIYDYGITTGGGNVLQRLIKVDEVNTVKPLDKQILSIQADGQPQHGACH